MDAAVARIELGALNAPAALLMLNDSDGRLEPDAEAGLKRYGCSPWPRPRAIEFSSCTASTISPLALDSAETLREELAYADSRIRLEEVVAEAAQAIRAELTALVASRALGGIVLAASGTTATLIATWLALGGAEERAEILVPGLDELGRGIPEAAAGRHTALRTPTGALVEAGRKVEGFPAELIVRSIPIRAEDGAPLPPGDAIDRIERAIHAATAAGRRVVLHAMEGSKTGLSEPGAAGLRELMRRWPGLAVIVDACQWRCGPERVAEYLEAGCLVVVTGSKFFCGPPLSGAVLVPESRADIRVRVAPGLADYSWRTDWSERWHGIAGKLSRKVNPGLLLRWRAALAEIHAYRSIPRKSTVRRLAEFAAAVRERFERSDCVLLPGPESIASVAVVARDGGFLDEARLRRLHLLVNQDVSSLLPAGAAASDRLLAACQVHLGQPVALPGTPWPAAIRLAIGARQLRAAEPVAPLVDIAAAKLRLVRDYLV